MERLIAIIVYGKPEFVPRFFSRGQAVFVGSPGCVVIAAKPGREAEPVQKFEPQGWLRFEANAAILTCCTCHEQLTGRVAEKWITKPTAATWWFSVDSNGQRYIDARKPLAFERVA